MNVDKLHSVVEEVKREIDRLVLVIENPEEILSKFYNAYNENLLQYVLEYMNISEDELYNLLIEQLGKMPVLSNCKITKIKSGVSSPLLVSYRKPEFRLLKIDIKGKKFENVFETVVRGLQVTINETEAAARKAEGDVNELKDVATKIYQLSNGDYALRGFAGITRKRNIRSYLDSVNYTKDDIDRIIGNLSGFVGRLSDSIDKRQAILAEAEIAHSEALDRKAEYDNNTFLQNAVGDLTSLLTNSGYELKKDLSTTLREGKI